MNTKFHTNPRINPRTANLITARREAVNLPAMPGQRISPFGHLAAKAASVLACEIRHSERGLDFATGEMINEYLARTDTCVVQETLAIERAVVCRNLGVALNTIRHQVSARHKGAFAYPRTDAPNYFNEMLEIALAIAEAYFPATVSSDISLCGATALDTAV